MVKIEVNGPLVYTKIEGDTGQVCVDAALAMNSIYCRIIKDRPSIAVTLRYFITEQVLNGTLFEDDDESGALDDIPETATKSRP